MSRLHIPLDHDILFATGDLLLRAEVDLLLKDNSGNWQAQTFRVDSGSDLPSMPAFRAKALDLPMPQKGVGLPVNTTAGPVTLTVRSGVLRIRVVGLGPGEYVIPCHFLGDPDQPPDPKASSAGPRNLLGLAGVVDKLRLTFDGTPTPGAAYGNLVVEKL
jgi:hypothetical protein